MLYNNKRDYRRMSNYPHFSVRSGQIRNIQSAKVSVPGQITKLVPVCIIYSGITVVFLLVSHVTICIDIALKLIS